MFPQFNQVHPVNLVMPAEALENLGIQTTGRKTYLRALLTMHSQHYAAEFFQAEGEHEAEFNGSLAIGLVPGEVFEIKTTDLEGNDERIVSLTLTDNLGLVKVADSSVEKYSVYINSNENSYMEFEVPTLSVEATLEKIAIIKKYQAEVQAQQEAFQNLALQAANEGEGEEVPVIALDADDLPAVETEEPVRKGPTLVS